MGAQPDEDRRLVERCLSGNDEAWRELVGRFAAPVAATISRIYRSRLGRGAEVGEAQEVAQEVFWSLARDRGRALRRFGWRCSLSTYLSAIAARCALKRLRHEARRTPPGKRVRMEIAGETSPTPGDDPFVESLARERADALEHAMAGLPPRDRFVLRAYYWHEAGVAGIAKALDLNEEYAWVLLRRALDRLKKAVGNMDR